MTRKVYTQYKNIVEYLGYKQLDVYRIVRDGKTVDIIRLMDPMSGQVGVIDLDAPREALSYREFLEKVIEGLEKAGLPVNERRVAALREKYPAQEAEAREAAS